MLVLAAALTLSNLPCGNRPLELHLGDMLLWGQTMDRLKDSDCRQQIYEPFRRPEHSYAVGRMPLGSFRLFGERLTVSLDVVNLPGNWRRGERDQLFLVPAIQLPPQWAAVMEQITYPVLIVGGAAVLTAVIVELARSAHR